MTFDAESTGEEVINHRDLKNKTILVTGVSSGVGAELARVLSTNGAHVIGAARNLLKAKAVIDKFSKESTAAGGYIDLISLDLADLSSVDACAEKLLSSRKTFDAVIANAGVMAIPKEITIDGLEKQFATNYLGHFVLLNRISPLMNPGCRVVMVSSAGHRGADVDLIDPNFEHTPYDPLVAYRRSKTAAILLAVEFNLRNKSRGVYATAVHPGAVITETTELMIKKNPAAAKSFKWKSVGQGAATLLWAAFVGPSEAIAGKYCEDCHVAEINDDPKSAFGVRSYAVDLHRAGQLWDAGNRLAFRNY